MMERTEIKKKRRKRIADAIFVSDIHLTDSCPVSRTDDYIETQRVKLAFLQKLSEKNNNCVILNAGDLFHHWKASPWLCLFTYQHLPRPFITIPGQHDLPMHSLAEKEKSALYLLKMIFNNGGVHVLMDSDQSNFFRYGDFAIIGKPYGTLDRFKVEALPDEKERRKILILHNLVWQNQSPSWSKGSFTDRDLLKKYGKYFDVILTGDNHAGFVTEQDGCLLVNPGSMLRATIDQENYEPRCYLYYAQTNEVVPAYFPVKSGVHSRDHFDWKKEGDTRISAYIEWMNRDRDWAIGGGLSFKRNLELYFESHQVSEKIRYLIWKHYEEGEL